MVVVIIMVVVQSIDVATGKDELILTAITVIILTNLHKIRRNKKRERIYIVETLKKWKIYVISAE
jgi:hypothetical protein